MVFLVLNKAIISVAGDKVLAEMGKMVGAVGKWINFGMNFFRVSKLLEVNGVSI